MRALVLLSLLAVSVAAEESVVVKLEPVVGGGAKRPAIRFPSVHLELTTDRPASLASRTWSAGARFAVIRFGEGGKSVALGFDKPESALTLGHAYGEGGELRRGHARVEPQTKSLFIDFVDVQSSGLSIDVRLRYVGMDIVSAVASLGSYRRGSATFDGKPREVLLIDGNGDGRFNGPADRWISLSPARLQATRVLREAACSLLGEPQVPFFRDGTALRVTDVAANGSKLTLVRDKPVLDEARVLARRLADVRRAHFARFELESTGFRERNELLGRTLVDTRAPWRKMPIRRAFGGDKPVLVFFYSESNPWCFRYEYYTFRDAAVDKLLRQFTLIRIDIEKDKRRNWQRYRGRGVPALMPLHVDGSAIEFQYLTRDAEGKTTELKTREKMIVGWQRPQELITNLKRILAITAED